MLTAEGGEMIRAYVHDEAILDDLEARWAEHAAAVRAQEADILLIQKGLWLCCRMMREAEKMAGNYEVFSLMPTIINLAAKSDGDYCDLGEAVYNLINRKFRDIAKHINRGDHHE